MNYVEIRSFEEVVLFVLQNLLHANGDRRLGFTAIWQACSAAAINLPGCPPPELRRQFASRLLTSLRDLEKKGLVSIHGRGFGTSKLITHVTAPIAGVDYLKETVFTHQERMGKNE